MRGTATRMWRHAIAKVTELDGHTDIGAAMGGETANLRRTQVSIHAPDPIAEIGTGLGHGPFELVLLFVSSNADFAALAKRAHEALEAANVVACTTAGEIGEGGYEDDQIIALGLPERNFQAECYIVDLGEEFHPQDETDRLIRTRSALAERAKGYDAEFAFVVIDGMSLREDELTATLASGLGGMPLFGGSAGDGTDFRKALLSLNGTVRDGCGIVSVIRSKCPIKVFSLNHLSPTETKMVVTDADPRNRIVRQINAEPAAKEYARIVGKVPDQLDQFTFAAHPVVVQLGERHHVRAIRRVNENGELVFFSAIDEGMVLTLAASKDLASHLDRELSELSAQETPEAILGCDCILRRLEAGQRQQTREVSEVLKAHNVRGFGTYGEQLGALHVNHTMTGVAFYPPVETPLSETPCDDDAD